MATGDHRLETPQAGDRRVLRVPDISGLGPSVGATAVNESPLIPDKEILQEFNGEKWQRV